MADSSPSPSTGAPIEALLQERARFQQWLTKLDTAASIAPPGVREKVRSDYESRLRAVITELRSHGTAIQEELDRYRSSQAELEGRRGDAEEMLAEAGVRHAVGEYGDEEWNRLRDDTSRMLGEVQGELTRVVAEITRLVEVQGLISETPRSAPAGAPAPADPGVLAAEAETLLEPDPAAPRPAPPIEMLPDPTPSVAAATGAPAQVEPTIEAAPQPPALATPAPAPSAPRFVPKPSPAAEPAHARAAAAEMDELAFLKSVSSEERKPGRRSNEHLRPELPAEPVATTASGGAGARPSAKPGAPSQQKTLKCGECGTLNRATEWYCERCGAELAAL